MANFHEVEKPGSASFNYLRNHGIWLMQFIWLLWLLQGSLTSTLSEETATVYCRGPPLACVLISIDQAYV